jgi:hypothetical protein
MKATSSRSTGTANRGSVVMPKPAATSASNEVVFCTSVVHRGNGCAGSLVLLPSLWEAFRIVRKLDAEQQA